MLKNLKIKNFRSIIDTDISFGGLTVLIGANGSGKSNILKGIKFISRFITEGLDKAIPGYNHFNSIVPKSIPKEDVNATVIKFDYLIELPGGNSSDVKSFNHVFEIKKSQQRNRVCDIVSEEIKFFNPFQFPEVKSEVIITRSSATGPLFPVKVKIEPAITVNTFDAVLSWFGLEGLKNSGLLSSIAENPQEFGKLYESIFPPNQDTANEASNKSFVGGELTTLLTLIKDLHVFRAQVSQIESYNFSSVDLRKAQPIVSNAELSETGKMMPAVLKLQTEDSIKRIQRALSHIAAHIEHIDVQDSIKENAYVEFTESNLKRKVASFDSSDGTLHALAIILAMEIQPEGTTMLIEEPEQNLHPWAIRFIIDFARDVIAAHKIQVILSTHSEHVLNCVNPEEVLIVTRTPQDGTKAKTIEEISPGATLEMKDVGRLWIKGLIDGVPS